MSDAPKCKHVKPDGTSCAAFCLSGSDYCFHHDPTRKQERTEARRRGGRARNRPAVVLPLTTPDVQVQDVTGVVSLLGETINHVRKGGLDVKVAHVTGYLSGILLKALEGNELARQIEEHDKEIAALKSEMEAMRRERHTAKTATAATNGAGRLAARNPPESSPGSDPRGRRGDHDEGGDDARFLADIPPFFDA